MTPAFDSSADRAARVELDHVGAIVRDLSAGAIRWERMGFRLTPVSRQQGRLPGRDDSAPWATANRCAIFERGYLELIGIVDPTAFNPWEHFLAKADGIHLLALRVQSADAAWPALSVRRALLGALDPPVQRMRKLDVDGVERTMGFRNIFSRDAACAEGRYIVIEHQTPEYLWQPGFLQHANGAIGLDAVYVCADASGNDGVLSRLAALTGAVPQADGQGGAVLIAPEGGRIECHPPHAFEARWGAPWRAAPFLAGVQVRFADRERAARCMEDNGVHVHRRGNDWYVAPSDAGGFVLCLA
jgi:hypothetical protein